MLEIEKWAQNKPPMIATMAQYFAVGAESLHSYFERRDQPELLDSFPQIDPPIWLLLMAIKKCTSFGKVKVYHPQVNLREPKPGSWLFSSGLHRSGPARH